MNYKHLHLNENLAILNPSQFNSCLIIAYSLLIERMKYAFTGDR